VNSFDQSCGTSSSTTPGWAALPGVTGAPSVEYQFVVDSHVLENSDSSGVIYVYATGRAGVSGRYVCATVQTAFDIEAPTVGAEQSVPMTPSQGWTGVHFPSGSTTLVTTVLDGASGAAGASDGTGTGGAGGQGAQLSTTFVIPSGDMVTSYAGSPGQLGTNGAGTNVLGWGDGGPGGNRGGGGGQLASFACSPRVLVLRRVCPAVQFALEAVCPLAVHLVLRIVVRCPAFWQ